MFTFSCIKIFSLYVYNYGPSGWKFYIIRYPEEVSITLVPREGDSDTVINIVLSASFPGVVLELSVLHVSSHIIPELDNRKPTVLLYQCLQTFWCVKSSLFRKKKIETISNMFWIFFFLFALIVLDLIFL